MKLFFCGQSVAVKKPIPRIVLLAMKLTIILLTVALMQVQANGFSQKLVTINLQNAPLKNIFTEITKQTGYVFFYEQKLIQPFKAITVKVSNAPIEQVLQLCFINIPLTYNIIDNVIVVKQKAALHIAEESSIAVGQGEPLTVTGKVVDDRGAPLVGANVKIKGTNIGTITDNEGRFTIPNVDANASLEIS